MGGLRSLVLNASSNDGLHGRRLNVSQLFEHIEIARTAGYLTAREVQANSRAAPGPFAALESMATMVMDTVLLERRIDQSGTGCCRDRRKDANHEGRNPLHPPRPVGTMSPDRGAKGSVRLSRAGDMPNER